MAIALSTERQTYILEQDRALPEEKQTKFFLKPLTAAEFFRVQDKGRSSEESRTLTLKDKDGKEKKLTLIDNATELAYTKLKLALVGWENLFYKEGSECPFTSDIDSNLARIIPYWQELALEVDAMCFLTEETEKN